MACRRKALRSSAVKSVFGLAHGLIHDAHDDALEDVRGPLDDVEVAVRDRVVGPGQTAMRPSGVISGRGAACINSAVSP